MRRITANGDAERLFLLRDGLEVDRFPLKVLSVAWLRQTFGAGEYRGNWFRQENGRWKPLGQLRGVRLSPLAGNDVRGGARTKPVRTVGFPFEVPPLAAAAAPAAAVDEREERDLVSARVRVERELSQMRLSTMEELATLRLNAVREEHRTEMRALERRLDELARRRDPEDDDDDEPEEPREAGPWDFLRPFFQEITPVLREVVPHLLAKLAAPGQLPEAKG